MSIKHALTALLGTVALAGCGGGDSPSEADAALGGSGDSNVAFTTKAMTQNPSGAPSTYTIDTTTPTLTGTAKGLSKVVISVDGVEVGTTSADASGNWSYQLPEQSEGVHTYAVLGQSTAGAYKTASINLLINNVVSLPGFLKHNPPTQVASLSVQQLTDVASSRFAGDPGLQTIASALQPKCGVSVRYIEYGTVGGNDVVPESTNASGALMVPTGPGCTGPRPIVLYAHGTAVQKDYNIANITADPTVLHALESRLVALFYASQGFIVVAPNYAGYDVSRLGYHPYLNARQQSTEMRHALAAARTALRHPDVGGGVTDSRKLFVTGYSEGGHVAMATVRAMQAAGETVTASAPMSGPYAVATFADEIVSGKVSQGVTGFFPMIVTSYKKAYPTLQIDSSKIFEAPYYAAGIDGLLPSTTPVIDLLTAGKLPMYTLFSSTPPKTGKAALDARLAAMTPPPTPDDLAPWQFSIGFGPRAEDPSLNLVNNSTRLSMLLDALPLADGGLGHPDGFVMGATPANDIAGLPAANPTHVLRKAVKKNDLRGGWAPSSPMLMCGGHKDPTVFYRIHTGQMAKLWAPQVTRGLVQVLDVDSEPAGPSDPFALPKQAFKVFRDATAAQAGGTVGDGAAGDMAVLNDYHGTVVYQSCTVAAQSFFKKLAGI